MASCPLGKRFFLQVGNGNEWPLLTWWERKIVDWKNILGRGTPGVGIIKRLDEPAPSRQYELSWHMQDVRPAASSLNADLYFAGPRAGEAHLGTAGCRVGFLNFPRRRGCLSDHRRSLRSYFTMTSSIASSEKQKPRNSSCGSIMVSIKTGSSLHYWLKEAPTDGDRRCRTPAG